MLVEIPMLSESAAYDDAMSRFAWSTYKGKPIELTQRKHKRSIQPGDLYGTRMVRGGNYYLIFADMYHVDFPIDSSVFERISKNSEKAPQPTLEQYAGARAPKAKGLKMLERKLQQAQFDAPRFTLKGIKRESANGVDLSNYQWRIVQPMVLRVRHSKGYENLVKGDIIGLRFTKPSKGGYLVNRDGLWALVKTEEYDSIVESTQVLALQDWPTGSLTADAISEYKANKADDVRRTEVERREAVRMEERANKLAAKLADRAKREEQRQKDRKRMAELGQIVRDAGERIKVSDMKPMTDEEYRNMKAGTQPTFASKVDQSLIDDDYDDADFDFEEKDVQPDNEHVIADNAGLMDTLDIALGLDTDAKDVEDGTHDLSDVPEEEDPNAIDDDLSKGRKKPKDSKPSDKKADAKKDGSKEDKKSDDSDDGDDLEDDGFDDSDDEDLGDDSDDEDLGDDSDSDDEDLGDDSDSDDEDDGFDDSDDEDLGDDSDDEDLGDDSDDEDSGDDIGDEDIDPNEDADENIGGDEEDPVDNTESDDVDTSDAGDAKTRKSAKEAEEGDLIVFHDDTKQKRQWLIIKVEPHKANDRILVYTLYDMAGKKEEVRQVRVNTAKGQHILDMCDKVGQVKPKEFSALQSKTEDFELNKEAISS